MNTLSIRRGTTPEITFSIPVDAQEVEKAEVIFYQGTSPVITKLTGECALSGKSLSVTLTQEETLLLNAGAQGYAKATVETEDMNLSSQRVLFTTQECLKDEVI